MSHSLLSKPAKPKALDVAMESKPKQEFVPQVPAHIMAHIIQGIGELWERDIWDSRRHALELIVDFCHQLKEKDREIARLKTEIKYLRHTWPK